MAGDVTVAGGGHPPALWLRPDAADGETVREVRPHRGMLVGALPDARFTTCRLRLEPGDTFLMYTDGLIEARPGGDFFGSDRLISFLADRVHTTAGDLIGDLTELIDGFEPKPADDVALLAVTVPGARARG